MDAKNTVVSLILERVLDLRKQEFALVQMSRKYADGDITALEVAVELFPLIERELLPFYCAVNNKKGATLHELEEFRRRLRLAKTKASRKKLYGENVNHQGEKS